MSGTFTENARPIEMLPVLNRIAPGIWPSRAWYLKRYCRGDEKGCLNEDEFNERIGRWMIRRKKDDPKINLQLPAKIREIVPLTATAAIIEFERKAAAEEEARRLELAAEIERARHQGNKDALREAEHKLRMLDFSAEHGGSMAKVQHEIGLAKVPDAISIIDAGLKTSGKIAVAAYHKDVIQLLAQPFGKRAVTYTGEHSQQQKEEAKLRFMRDPDCGLWIANYIAGGTGVDGLQEVCNHMVMVERDWRPGMNDQLEDRLWRIGQKRGVLIQVLVMEGTLDEKKQDVLERKRDLASRLLDTREEAAGLLSREVA
jgi:SNF2 family DNA or RNA helicase